MSEEQILCAAISEANKGKNPFFSFQDRFNTPEPYIDLIRITSEYVTPGCYPFLIGEHREKWLRDRLEKFRIKYLEVI